MSASEACFGTWFTWHKPVSCVRWLTELGIEHVHAHYGTNSAMVAMLCRMIGGPPYSFTMHGPEEFDAPRSLSLREKIHHAAFVVAITEFTRSQLYRWADYVDWPKIHVIRVGVSPMFLEHGPSPIPAAPTAGEYWSNHRAEGPGDSD